MGGCGQNLPRLRVPDSDLLQVFHRAQLPESLEEQASLTPDVVFVPVLVGLIKKRRDVMQVVGLDPAQLHVATVRLIAKHDQSAME